MCLSVEKQNLYSLSLFLLDGNFQVSWIGVQSVFSQGFAALSEQMELKFLLFNNMSAMAPTGPSVTSVHIKQICTLHPMATFGASAGSGVLYAESLRVRRFAR